MLASEAWYASGIFWGAVTAAVTVAAAVISLIIWRVGPPRRLLTYGIPVATSLLSSNTPSGLARDDLRITYHDTVLSDPYVVSFRIENRSRRDISSKDFDESKPLAFEISADIIGFVGGDRSIENPAKGLQIENNKIKIGPTLITQRQVIACDLLVDGPPQLKCESPLIEVTVREETPEDVSAQRSRKNILKASTVVFFAGIIILILWFIPMSQNVADAFGWVVVGLLLIAGVAMVIVLEESYTIAKYTARRKLSNLRRSKIENLYPVNQVQINVSRQPDRAQSPDQHMHPQSGPLFERLLGSGRRGRRFKSGHPDQLRAHVISTGPAQGQR